MASIYADKLTECPLVSWTVAWPVLFHTPAVYKFVGQVQDFTLSASSSGL